jgi:prevent-host-death family protein
MYKNQAAARAREMQFSKQQKTRARAVSLVDFLLIIQIIRSISRSENPMSQTTAMEFQRKFGEFQHRAQREPVEITRHGRRELVLMSAEHYDWLVAAARRVGRTADAPAIVTDAVRRAEMNPRHAHLDKLMK